MSCQMTNMDPYPHPHRRCRGSSSLPRYDQPAEVFTLPRTHTDFHSPLPPLSQQRARGRLNHHSRTHPIRVRVLKLLPLRPSSRPSCLRSSTCHSSYASGSTHTSLQKTSQPRSSARHRTTASYALASKSGMRHLARSGGPPWSTTRISKAQG
jgi:hypothetical protein